MNLKQLLDVLHESTELSAADELKGACDLIIRVQKMDSGERDVIRSTHRHGPLGDGDVPSKRARDKLLDEGFVSKVVVRGEEGYNACTYKGARAYRLLEAGA